MVPLRLQLTNFLSYGESSAPIEFDGIHVACLCGPNGHGKSALLDSITWALWGQARSNAADDLVRLGQAQMQVEFEFLLDGQTFRVIRKRSKGKNSQSDLQLQFKKSDGEWQSLTGQGVRDTQQRINDTLRMDYETFINSAFILQGRADEFARKPAGERKRILGEILSLSVYDQLADAARARRLEAQSRKRSLENEILRLEQDYARKPQLEGTVARLTVEREQAQAVVAQAQAAFNEIRIEKTRMDARKRERDELNRRLERAESDLKLQRGLLGTAQGAVERSRALVERAGEIRTRAREYAAVRREQEELTVRFTELRALEAERAQLQQRLQVEEGRLNTAVQLARQRVRELHGRLEQQPKFHADLADLKRQVEALDRLQAERTTLEQRLQALAAERAEAGAEQRRLAGDLEKADERFHLLKTAQAQCPVCQGPLPEETRKDLGWKLRDEKAALKQAQGQAIQREADARRAEDENSSRLRTLDSKLRTGQEMRNRLAQAEQRGVELEQYAAELPDALREAETLEAKLKSGDFAFEERQALADLEHRIRAISYDDQRVQRLAARVRELAGAERDLQALESAETELPGLTAQVEQLAAMIRDREEAMAEDRVKRAEADRDLTRAAAVDAQAAKLEGEFHAAERLEAQLLRDLGAAQQALEHCNALQTQIADRKTERDLAAKDEAAYEELTKAFGRNGIQALIIENAIPEIEQEANALLSRMTDGQFALRLRATRALKAGGQAETLDIEISDGLGDRKYELYSGGEAFRVNFALRIALSKLLARRAGARLETLVIDEGFGSQDQDGRQRLVEAIESVREDFAKILVITHLDELKDAFPTRIEVSKGPGGSQVAVY